MQNSILIFYVFMSHLIFGTIMVFSYKHFFFLCKMKNRALHDFRVTFYVYTHRRRAIFLYIKIKLFYLYRDKLYYENLLFLF